MTKDIFISYRRHDSSSFAARVRDRLEQTFPDQVFLDVSGIDAGDDFIDRLKSAVLASKVVVAIIGPSWASNRPGRPALGDAGDVVTQEITTALDADIPVVPVRVDAAQMPSAADLPLPIQALPRRNAISISHERFDSDMSHLVTALYKPLGITPPNRVEKILELAARGGFSHRTRDRFALFGAGACAVAVLFAVQWVTISRSEPRELMPLLLVSGLALVLGVLGLNSLRRRRWAIAAVAISAVTLLSSLGFGVWRGLSLLQDPWLTAMQVAQAHVNRPEIPEGQIGWSTRALITTPLPTVECDCLTMADTRKGTLPHPPGTTVDFTNRCKGAVTLALSRSKTAFVASTYPWFAMSGRDFAVVTLGPDQTVRVPMEGTFGGAFQPWICLKEAAPPTPGP